MSRVIKFRAWHKLNEEMIYEGWTPPKNNIWRTKDDLFRLGESAEIMQFTGLTDKNGTEIYEGDILLWDNNGFSQQKPLEWCGNGFWIKSESGDNYLPNVREVIGNIFSNPELLKS